MNTYECVICQSVNSSVRLHCQFCGTVPAMYSVLKGKASRLIEHDGRSQFIEVHSVSSMNKPTQRINLKTVSSDYYAQE